MVVVFIKVECKVTMLILTLLLVRQRSPGFGETWICYS